MRDVFRVFFRRLARRRQPPNDALGEDVGDFVLLFTSCFKFGCLHAVGCP